MVKVSASALKQKRKDRGWNRQQLSEASQVDMSTISRLERGYDANETSNVRVGTVEKLASALGVSLEELQEQSQAPLERDFVKFKISDMSRNALELVSKRYGIARNAIVEFAPLLFCILAEQSLRNRKQKLERLRHSISACADRQQEISHLPAFGFVDLTVLDCEEISIQNRDLFCDKLLLDLDRKGLGRGGMPLGHDPISNLLKSYIEELLQFDSGLKNTLNPVYMGHVISDFPIHYICFDEALAEFDGDRGSAFAVIKGVAPLHEMPKGDAKIRARWAKQKYKEDQGEDPEEDLDKLIPHREV